jgi:hypothetical protein
VSKYDTFPSGESSLIMQFAVLKIRTDSNCIGPCAYRDRDYCIRFDPTFGSFTLWESVSHSVNWFLWWKCLDCLNWNRCFLVFRNVDTVGRCTTSSLLAGPACLWHLVVTNWNQNRRCWVQTHQSGYPQLWLWYKHMQLKDNLMKL